MKSFSEEKCNGCKWLIEFGSTKVGCLNSKRCINYSEYKKDGKA